MKGGLGPLPYMRELPLNPANKVRVSFPGHPPVARAMQ